ncbi:hypothetical protein GEMRC1_008351 [Eukaryota sp. GEM-RC1]
MLVDGEFSLTGGHFSFPEILVLNSSGGNSVSFTDTFSLNVYNFTSTNCHLDLNLQESSESTILDVFFLQGSTLESRSFEIFFNNLTLIDSKRLGSGNISADWLSISDSEFSGDAFTNCVGRCYVKNDVSNTVSISNNHDLIFSGSSYFTADFSTLVFELESSSLEVSGHLDISGCILVSDDSDSNFKISGTTQIINGGSLEVENYLDLTGCLSVIDGQLILTNSNDFTGNLSILESGHANFSGSSYVFQDDSTFALHPNNLEFLHSDPVVTIKGSFIGVEYFNHSKGEFKFVENSIFDTPFVYLTNSAFLNISDTDFKLDTTFEVDSGIIELKYLNHLVLIEIPSIMLVDEILVLNSSGGNSVSFIDTFSLNVNNFTSTNCHLDFHLQESSESTILDVFVLQGSTLESRSFEIFFNNLTLIDSKRLGSGNISADWLSISDSEFSGDAFTNCVGRCYVKNDVSNTVSISNNHDLIFSGSSYFTADFSTLVFELESSSLEVFGHLDISGCILLSDDSDSNFKISGTSHIINGGSLEVENYLDLTGFLSVIDGQLILTNSNDFTGNLSILESGHASFCGSSYVFHDDSTFVLHPNNLELLHSDPVVTIKGTFIGVEYFNHSKGEFKFVENSIIDTPFVYLSNSAFLNIADTDFKLDTSFEVDSGIIELNYLNHLVLIEIPSIMLVDGEFSLTGGHFSFPEILVLNSSGGNSVSFIDTFSLNVNNFTSANCHLDFHLQESSESAILDVFILQGSTLESRSFEIFFNNLTLIDSKRLGSGNISADWLSISDSEFSGDAFTNCVGRCYVKNDVSNTVSISNNHDLIFSGSSYFTADFSTLVFELESSSLEVSGHLDISGCILLSDDSDSNFKISGTSHIINGGSLEVENYLDLTGFLSVIDGQLILTNSNDFTGNLSILESGHANFCGSSYVFHDDSTFVLHPNNLELLHSDPVVTIKGTFIGVEYFNHSKGEFKFVENSIIDTPFVYLSNSAFLNIADTDFKLDTSFEVDSGIIELNYLNHLVLIEIPSIMLVDGEFSLTGGHFSFPEILVLNSSGGNSVSFIDTFSLNVNNFTSANCHLDFHLQESSESAILDVFILQGSTLESRSFEIFFNNLTLIDSKRLGSGNISADWLSISDSEFSGDAFTNCVGRCYVNSDFLNFVAISNNHDLIFQPPYDVFKFTFLYFILSVLTNIRNEYFYVPFFSRSRSDYFSRGGFLFRLSL